MTEQHRAKPEVWAAVEGFGNKNDMDIVNCVLELRSRVEALESDAKPAESNYPAEPDSSLVERVQAVIGHSYPDDARAAILEVAAWVDRLGYHTCAADLRNGIPFQL